MNNTAIVIQAEATEQQLIDRARAALDNSHWIVGQCASEWTQRYAKGRTDADFGKLVGLERDQVCQRRKVWETFSDTHHTYPHLSWSHFYAATSWDDAPECLQWANEISASVREMVEYRKRGQAKDDPQDEAEQELVDDPETDFGIITADHPCTTNPVVDHKTDCASEEDLTESSRDGREQPDRIERESPVTRKPEVPRAVNWTKAEQALRELLAAVRERNSSEDREALKLMLRSMLSELEGEA